MYSGTTSVNMPLAQEMGNSWIDVGTCQHTSKIKEHTHVHFICIFMSNCVSSKPTFLDVNVH